MMNLHTTAFWLDQAYRPAGCRQHRILQNPVELLHWISGRQAEPLLRQLMDEARLDGRNLQKATLAKVLAQALQPLQDHLKPDWQDFVRSHAEAELPLCTGYADGQTTTDWLRLNLDSGELRRRARQGESVSALKRHCLQAAAEINLDPLFVSAYLRDLLPEKAWAKAA
ncbi:MAG: hypothetical protein ACPHCJ_01965 [Oceanococcaceae bacterium]